jgi:hypothetical protein
MQDYRSPSGAQRLDACGLAHVLRTAVSLPMADGCLCYRRLPEAVVPALDFLNATDFKIQET